MRSKLYLLLLFLILLCPESLLAQREFNIWYFGDTAGLDFNGPVPVALGNGRTRTFEGTASIADRNTGRLLFYTDGETVWNIDHRPMPNGRNLKGSFSATQSALIVPMPGDSLKYYIFTADAGEYWDMHEGMHYSIVDMRADFGRGDIVTKNVSVLFSATEKLCAVRQCNGRDYWILMHGWRDNRFYAYSLTKAGLSRPVISSVGLNHDGNSSNTIGWMQPSHDGRKLALAIYGRSIVQLFNFNPLTGVVSDPLTIRSEGGDTMGAYGVCFSPDNTKLYVSEYASGLYQYDVSVPDSSLIADSRTKLYDDSRCGAVQMGPDKKIYWTTFDRKWLGVVQFPDVPGIGCTFIPGAQRLGTGTSTGGLPNVINNDIKPSHASGGPDAVACPGGSVQLSAGGGEAYVWTPAIGLSCTNCPNPIATPSGNITYAVRILNSGRCDIIDSVRVTMRTLKIGADTNATICRGDSAQLSASGASVYFWTPSDGLSCTDCPDPKASPAVTTTYTVFGTNDISCRDSLRITVTVRDTPTTDITPGPRTVVCAGDSVRLSSTAGTMYTWSPAAGLSCTDCREPYARPTRTTRYTVVVANELGCTGVDTVLVVVDSTARADAGRDLTICAGGTAQLKGSGNGRYLWTPSAGLSCTDCAEPIAMPTATTVYRLRVTNSNGCAAVDSVTVTVTEKTVADAGADRSICLGDTAQLVATGGAVYTWTPAEGLSCVDCPDPKASPTVTTTYRVRAVAGTNCEAFDSVTITVNARPTATAGSDVVLCEGDSARLLATGGDAYAWSPVEGLSCVDCPDPVARPTVTTAYVVAVSGANGCPAYDTVVVTVLPAPVADAGSGGQICPGDNLRLSASDGASWSWFPSDSLSCTDCREPVARPTVTTTYRVTITSANGCTASDTVTVEVYDLAPLDLGPDVAICGGGSVPLNPGGAVGSYRWFPAVDLSCDTCANPIASPQQTTTYSVEVTTAEGCVQRDEVVVIVDQPRLVRARIDREQRTLPGRVIAVPILLDDAIAGQEIDTMLFSIGYAPGALRFQRVLQERTLLADWRVETIEEKPGRYAARLIAPPGTTLRRPDTLLFLEFLTFLGDTSASELPFTLEIPGVGCIVMQTLPGRVRLDSVCGLNFRLIEATGQKYALEQNTPNPFNPTTTIEFSLGLDGPTRLEIYDAAGKRAAVLVDDHLPAGRYRVEWDARDHPSGVYYCRIHSGEWARTQRMLLVK